MTFEVLWLFAKVFSAKFRGVVSFGGISEQAVKVFFAKVSHYTVRHLVRLVCSLMVKSTGLQNGRSKFPVPLWSDVEVCSPDIFYLYLCPSR